MGSTAGGAGGILADLVFSRLDYCTVENGNQKTENGNGNGALELIQRSKSKNAKRRYINKICCAYFLSSSVASSPNFELVKRLRVVVLNEHLQWQKRLHIDHEVLTTMLWNGDLVV